MTLDQKLEINPLLQLPSVKYFTLGEELRLIVAMGSVAKNLGGEIISG